MQKDTQKQTIYKISSSDITHSGATDKTTDKIVTFLMFKKRWRTIANRFFDF